MKELVILALLFLLCVTVCSAEDWTTTDGKTYHNVTVTKVEPDVVDIFYDGGMDSLKLADLPPDLQKRFKYDPKAAQEATQVKEVAQARSDAILAASIKADAIKENNAATDPIAHLVATLSASHGMWVNGATLIVHLPKTASPEELVATPLKESLIKNYKIIRVEHVQIKDTLPDSSFTAVLVHTDPADKIVILQYMDQFAGQGPAWSGKVYDSGW